LRYAAPSSPLPLAVGCHDDASLACASQLSLVFSNSSGMPIRRLPPRSHILHLLSKMHCTRKGSQIPLSYRHQVRPFHQQLQPPSPGSSLRPPFPHNSSSHNLQVPSKYTGSLYLPKRFKPNSYHCFHHLPDAFKHPGIVTSHTDHIATKFSTNSANTRKTKLNSGCA